MTVSPGTGGMAGGFFATNLGGMQILGLEGWRCAFHLVAALSIVTSVLVMWLAVDPRRKIAVRPLARRLQAFLSPDDLQLQRLV